MRTEDAENQPPIEWFTGIGRADKGISNVSLNESFLNLGDGEVGRHYNQWSHYTGNPIIPNDPAERVQRATQVLAEAEEFIKQATGYHPRDIMEVSHRLSREYRGKQEAPFTVELY